MHDFEIVAIWFLSVIAQMIFTMLLPSIFSESRSSEANQVESEPFPAYQGLHERASSIIPIATEA